MSIRDEMPLLARHEGEWHGTYTFVDPQMNVIDRHESVLLCTFPDDDAFPYFQVNEYTWPDGRKERIEFPGTLSGGKLHFDTERIRGVAWEVDENVIVLHWRYKADEAIHLYELIHLSESGKDRARTWHWFRDGVCFQRTLIDERKVD